MFTLPLFILLKSSKVDIKNAFNTIFSLFEQTYGLPSVVLLLESDDIIETESIIPEELTKYLDKNLFVRKYNSEIALNDIFKDLKDRVVLTVESGSIYSKNWLYCVILAYVEHKEAFVACEFNTVDELSDEILFKDFALIEFNSTGKLYILKSKEIVVSMTSYPPRIHSAVLSLKTIYKQTKLPDKVILWLEESEFPNKMKDLPEGLKQLIIEKTLSIRWCKEDLKSHKKYFWVFKEYPDALVITVDDDVVYPPQRIEDLYLSYLLHPQAVSAARACLIPISQDGEIPTCKSWPVGIDAFVSRPSLQLSAIGDAGVLYPTNLFSGVRKLLDIEAIKHTCLYNDDLWLKAMEIVAGIPVVVAEGFEFLIYTPNSQKIGLYHENWENSRSDKELLEIKKEIDRRYGNNFFLQKLMDPAIGEHLVGVKVLADLIIYYQNKEKKIKRDYLLKNFGISEKKK